ncbi:MAG: phospholipid scramblase-related protein [Kiritimatiellia bacterium]|jgi:uncharacterized protein YxjI|nr:phospholipid scramblase-related protein [Kiritimatiellia bacterium]MDP6848383.1 phospholipid scramblase-related protein [Kiritimatiellia bacterium]
MKGVLDKNRYFVRETTSLIKASFSYDILDPETGDVLMTCREQHIGPLTKFFRFSDLRRITPFDFLVADAQGEPVIRLKRGLSFMVSRVHVYDESDIAVGGFSLRPFSISGIFDVLDATGEPVCELKGGLTGWNYRFLSPDEVELARVRKKWAGVGKELFASGSDYVLEIDEAVPPGGTTRQLLMASALCIGMILKIDA